MAAYVFNTGQKASFNLVETVLMFGVLNALKVLSSQRSGT